MKRNIIILWILLLSSQIMICQSSFVKDTVYIDEFNKLSFKELTLKKCKSNVYYCDVIAYDSIVAYHVYRKFIFGSIEKSKLAQYYNILKNRMNVELDSSSTLIIDYRMNINSYKSYINRIDSLKSNGIEGSEHKYLELSFNRYKHRIKKSFRRRKKCIKQIKKTEKVIPVFIYSKNEVVDSNNEYYTDMKKDYNNVFHNNFFTEKGLYKLLIIKPNGDFFLKSTKASQNDFSDKDIFKLLKSNNWKPYFEEYKDRQVELNKTIHPIRIMRDFYRQEHHCF